MARTYEISRPAVQVGCGHPGTNCTGCQYAHFVPGDAVYYRLDGRVVSEEEFESFRQEQIALFESSGAPVPPILLDRNEVERVVREDGLPKDTRIVNQGTDRTPVQVDIPAGQRYRLRAAGQEVGPWREGPATIQVGTASVLEVEECRPVSERGEGIAGSLEASAECPEGHGPLGPRPRCLQCGRQPVWRRP